MILLSSPLKNDPLETTVSIFFSRNLDIHNQNSQLKMFEKICCQLLSTMNVLKTLRDSKVTDRKGSR